MKHQTSFSHSPLPRARRYSREIAVAIAITLAALVVIFATGETSKEIAVVSPEGPPAPASE